MTRTGFKTGFEIVTLLWHDKDKQLGLANYAPCIGVVGSCNKISTDIDREILYQLAGGFDGGTPEDFISD